MFPLTIIRCNPGQHRGMLRGFTITQAWPDHREVYAVIAMTGQKALAQIAALQEQRANHKRAAA